MCDGAELAALRSALEEATTQQTAATAAGIDLARDLEIAQARAEKAERERDDAITTVNGLTESEASALARVERLAGYAKHKPGCFANGCNHLYGHDCPCRCGLAAALGLAAKEGEG